MSALFLFALFMSALCVSAGLVEDARVVSTASQRGITSGALTRWYEATADAPGVSG